VSQTGVKSSLLQPSWHIFPHLLSSNYKSTQTCLYACFRWSSRMESRVLVQAGRRRLGRPLRRSLPVEDLPALRIKPLLAACNIFQTYMSFCKRIYYVLVVIKILWEIKWFVPWFICVMNNWLVLVWIWIRHISVELSHGELFGVEKHICLSHDV
jgi:hypothetical protein